MWIVTFISHIKINIQVIDYTGSAVIIPIIFLMIILCTIIFLFPREKNPWPEIMCPLIERSNMKVPIKFLQIKISQQNDWLEYVAHVIPSWKSGSSEFRVLLLMLILYAVLKSFDNLTIFLVLIIFCGNYV